MNYLFDVDGTLTPARQRINRDFKLYFGNWVTDKRHQGHRVFIVTGSDKRKTIEQIGVALWRHLSADGCYQCSGNQLYIRGRLVKSSAWEMPPELRTDIKRVISNSPWYGEAPVNIEERVGMVNISTIGRACNQDQREAYDDWDKKNGEREAIVQDLSAKYPHLEFLMGGEISVDIYPKGCDKSQVLPDMRGQTLFFGDKCKELGNDFTIAKKSDGYYHVKDWQETCDILMSL